MPRPSRPRQHRGRPLPPRRGSADRDNDPTARLRSLIQAGIVTTAALAACSDLEIAAASMHRLGTLSSGMWRALSRELAGAAERLDRQAGEHLENLERRADTLHVDVDRVLAVGTAAAHLDEHLPTLATLLPKLDEDARRLAEPDVLIGFVADDLLLLGGDEDELLEADEDEQDQSGEDSDSAADTSQQADVLPAGIGQVWLYLWPAPLSPARVSIMPEAVVMTEQEATDASVKAPEALIQALATTRGLPPERIPHYLLTLAMACWSAHQLDDLAGTEEEEDDADIEEVEEVEEVEEGEDDD